MPEKQPPERKEKEGRMKEIRDKRKKVICQLMEDELYVPMKEKELAAFMQVKPEDRPEFSQILNELVLEECFTSQSGVNNTDETRRPLS